MSESGYEQRTPRKNIGTTARDQSASRLTQRCRSSLPSLLVRSSIQLSALVVVLLAPGALHAAHGAPTETAASQTNAGALPLLTAQVIGIQSTNSRLEAASGEMTADQIARLDPEDAWSRGIVIGIVVRAPREWLMLNCVPERRDTAVTDRGEQVCALDMTPIQTLCWNRHEPWDRRNDIRSDRLVTVRYCAPLLPAESLAKIATALHRLMARAADIETISIPLKEAPACLNGIPDCDLMISTHGSDVLLTGGKHAPDRILTTRFIDSDGRAVTSGMSNMHMSPQGFFDRMAITCATPVAGAVFTVARRAIAVQATFSFADLPVTRPAAATVIQERRPSTEMLERASAQPAASTAQAQQSF